MGLSLVVWVMMGIAFWHFAVLVPDKFWGGIIGAFLAAVAGALVSATGRAATGRGELSGTEGSRCP